MVELIKAPTVGKTIGAEQDIAFEIVNSIHGKSLQRWVFSLALVEGTDLVLHTDIMCLCNKNFVKL